MAFSPTDYHGYVVKFLSHSFGKQMDAKMQYS